MMNMISYFFFFNDTATTEIYTLSLHDALPISPLHLRRAHSPRGPDRAEDSTNSQPEVTAMPESNGARDRKSTRLNSSHANISYAVFCLKKKTKKKNTLQTARS